MESLGVIKPDMRIERQDTLSPFGLLTQLFTQELLRRNARPMESYRPLRLAYLEEEEQDAAAAPEIHFDLDVDLIVNRLLKQEKAKKKEKDEKKTPAERIIERVILREKEIRTAYPETRRVVVESGGKRITGSLPVRNPARVNAPAQGKESIRESEGTERQAGERRSTRQTEVLRPSAALAPFAPAAAGTKRELTLTTRARTLTLASQAMSVPSAGGWTPKEREVHPGYPVKGAKTSEPGLSAGSILLPDVMRRRREAALERRETPGLTGGAPETLESLENALTWAVEGTDETPETERLVREVRRAVMDTVRRNAAKETAPRENAPAERASEREWRSSSAPRAGETDQKRSSAPAARPQEEALRSGTDVAQTGTFRKELQAGQAAASGETAVREERFPEETGLTVGRPSDIRAEERAPLIYREESAQQFSEITEDDGRGAQSAAKPVPAAPTKRGDGQITAGSAAIREEYDKAASPRSGDVPGGEQTARSAETAVPGVPVSPEAAAAKTVIPAALPAEGAAAGAPAALVYREETEGSAQPLSPRQNAEERAPERIPEAAVQTANIADTPATAAIPAEPAAQVGKPAALVYREGTEASGASAVPQRSGEEQRPQKAADVVVAVTGEAESPAAAVPAEPAAQIGEPAALVYREGTEEAEASAAPQRRAEEHRPQRAAETAAYRQPGEKPGDMEPAAQKPVSKETVITAAGEAESPAAAIPAEPAAQVGEPAALVYREGTEEAEASPSRQRNADEQTPQRETETVVHIPPAIEPRSAVSPNVGPAAQTPVSPETVVTVAGKTESPASVLPAAIPAEQAASAEKPAALIYREGTEEAEASPSPQRRAEEHRPQETTETASRTRPAIEPRSTASPDRGPAAQKPVSPETAFTVVGEAESPAPVLPTALPAEPAAPSGTPAALIYREGTEEAEASAARQRRAEENRPQGTTETASRTRPAIEPRSAASPDRGPVTKKPVSPETAFTVVGEAESPAPVLPAALPAEPAATTEEPAVVVYREAAEETPRVPEAWKRPGQPEGPAAPFPQQRNAEEQRIRSTSERVVENDRTGQIRSTVSPQGEPAAAKTGISQEIRIQEREAPGPSIPAAIPAEAAASAGEPPVLVYREEASEEAPRAPKDGKRAGQPAGPAAIPLPPQRNAENRQTRSTTETAAENERTGQIRSTVSPQGEPAAAKTGVSREIRIQEREAPGPSIPAAIPAEAAAPAEEPPALVYREAEMTAPPQGGEETPPTPPAPEAEEGPRAVPAQALPVSQMSIQADAPILLTHRTEADAQFSAAASRAARDIRVTAEHEPLRMTPPKRGQRPEAKAAKPAAGRPGRSESPVHAAPEAKALPAAAPVPEAGTAQEQAPLVYAAPAQAAESLAGEAAARPSQKAQDNKNESLPSWAKELLEQAGVTDTAQQAAAFSGRVNGVSAGRTVNWTAPAAGTPSRVPGMDAPAELSFREREHSGETPYRPPISDAELRRTADRVYRIIEERLRLELRRSGR